MKSNMYAVYDKKAQNYSRPFEAHNHDCAKRIVAATMEVDSLLRKYPTDYRIDHISTYDYDAGHFDSLPEKEIVCEVANIVPLAVIGDDTGERTDRSN